ncbi:unnamed protein product [Pocillopora meandrina]|uniref:HhH-GPD domain-containing protein n=1 Tax=Pocillopora meandrina TaxID=46732 RepID=A0AAU9W992_9CNID|nr:unnamed protein product [Pocillopora meandrina]
MRKTRDAPVDSQGCEKTADESQSPEMVRYQVLISLMLSSQRKDQVTFAAMGKLKAYGLTIENILTTSTSKIGELIYPVGFWKVSKFLSESGTTLLFHHHILTNSIAPLSANFQVWAQKMVHITMNVAWRQVTGTGVDTHVHRISNRPGWVKKCTKLPEETRIADELNVLMVGFGQETCVPVSPMCKFCLNSKICPEG